MIDLHLHLDGSLPLERIPAYAQMGQIVLPATSNDLKPYFCVEKDCKSLNDYLTKFDLPCRLLQREDQIERAVYDLVTILAAQGLAAAEIRFAPQLHTASGLSMDAVVEAAISGLAHSPIPVGLILCCMRLPDNQQENAATIDLCKRFLNKGVIAADLAGAEALFPTEDYLDLFRYANHLDIPFTIHSGEAAGPESIRAALEAGASRIGHGIRCLEDPLLTEELIRRQIPLEMCPTSNVQTCACASMEAHPAIKLLRMGACVTINTDNMTVSDTTLAREYELLQSHCGMTDQDYQQLRKNSRRASFLTLPPE